MNSHQQRAQELEERTVVFSIKVVRQCGKLTKTPELKPLINQIIRSATSIGANYAEANNASSVADFRSKVYIAKKEAAETRYWLRVLSGLLPNEDFSEIMQEAKELNLIMQKIVSTIKSSNGLPNGK